MCRCPCARCARPCALAPTHIAHTLRACIAHLRTAHMQLSVRAFRLRNCALRYACASAMHLIASAPAQATGGYAPAQAHIASAMSARIMQVHVACTNAQASARKLAALAHTYTRPALTLCVRTSHSLCALAPCAHTRLNSGTYSSVNRRLPIIDPSPTSLPGPKGWFWGREVGDGAGQYVL